MKVFAIIPARYASSRFPGKPLARIQDKSMIQHVYENVSKSEIPDKVVVATDDKRIMDEVESFGGKAVLTSPQHPSGTDRCGEVALLLEKDNIAASSDIILNIQGDEPFINPVQIAEITDLFRNKNVNIATLAKEIKSEDRIFDANVIKIVFDNNGRALYFSRQAIPYLRDFPDKKWGEKAPFYEHIGMYAFRLKTLKKLIKLSQGKLETFEKLEQLRWLENSQDIYVNITEKKSFSVDTPEDLEKIKQLLD